MVYRKLEGKKDEVQMRKYQQLLSCALAIISTALFLFYKHEYDRLRAVLEVLDTFGNGIPQQDCAISLSDSEHIPSAIGLSPTPAWQKFGGLLIYSAFYVSRESTGQSEIAVLGFLSPDSQPITDCAVWFENRKKPLEGKLSVESLDIGDKSENFSLVAARFSCKVSVANSQVPYAVSLSKYDAAKPPMLLTYVHNSKVVPPSSGNTTAICLLTLSGPYGDMLQLAEYLEFHRLQGVTDFFIYEQGVEPKVKNLLKIFQQGTNVNINLLPWNLADDFTTEMTSTLLVNDCLLRSRSSANYVLVSSVDQLFVPRHHADLRAVFRDIEETNPNPVAHLIVSHRTFCLEYSSDLKEAAKLPLTILKKTRWSETSSSPSNYLLMRTSAVNSVQNKVEPMFGTHSHSYVVSPDVMLVHWYKKCGKASHSLGTSQQDNVMHKYKDKLLDSGVFQFDDR